MVRSCFTPQSARAALEWIRPAAERICTLYDALERRRPARIAPDGPVDPAYFVLLRRLVRRIDELGRHGVRVQDARLGLVDLPARRDGRAVWLCWRVGEPSLDWWHEDEAGFAARQRVDEDGPWDAPSEPAGVR